MFNINLSAMALGLLAAQAQAEEFHVAASNW